MITNNKKLQDFEKELIRREQVDLTRNFRIVEALYSEAVALGVIPAGDPLEGIKTDIKIARVINS
jgi:hypothetical protein